MMSNVNGVIDCIDNNFKYFHAPEFLKVRTNGRYKDRFCITNTKYNFFFNHESFIRGQRELYDRERWKYGPKTFVRDNFKEFVKRYTQRVENFRYYCESSDYHVNFVIQFSREKYSDELMNKLKTTIKNKYPKLDHEITVLPREYRYPFV